MTPSDAAPPDAPDPAELCRRLRETPQMQDLLATSPAFPTPGMVSAPLTIGLLSAAVFASIFARQTVLEDDPSKRLTWAYWGDRAQLTFYYVAIGLSLLAAAYGIARRRRFERAPATAVPAVALSKEAETYWLTTYRMTFWFEGRGESEEVVDVDTFGDVRPGDVGAAWFRDGRFVGFLRLAT